MASPNYPGMMGETDPEVKSLQELAWNLQNLSTKPGCRLPEDAKRDSYRLTSKAIALCTNADYVERSDFMERAAIYRKQIEAKKIELQELEEAIKQDRSGKCYRATTDGGYTVGLRDTGASGAESADVAMLTTGGTFGGSGGQHVLTAKEVSAMCGDDPEALWLGGVGMHDPDVAALLEGLKRSGSQLTSIDLSHNQIADAGIQKLVAGFAGGLCPKLQELWLGGNAFGDLGVQMLNSGLKLLRKDLSVHLTEGDTVKPEKNVDAIATTKARPDEKEKEPHETMPKLPAEEPASSQKEIDFQMLDGKVRAQISMPDSVNSAEDFELDISEHRLVVHAAGSVVGDASMPCLVNPETAQAKFSRKTHVLSVTMDIVG